MEDNMKQFNAKYIGVILIIIILFSISLFYHNGKYKEDIGAYDIYTLVLLEERIDNFVLKYNKGEINEQDEHEFKEDMMLISEYLRRSPILNFMNDPVIKIGDLIVYGYSEKDVICLSNLQKELKSIVILLHEDSNDNIGVVTYDYFKNEDNIKNLIRILCEI